VTQLVFGTYSRQKTDFEETSLDECKIESKTSFIMSSVQQLGRADTSVPWQYNKEKSKLVRYKYAGNTSGYIYWVIENLGEHAIHITF